MDLHTAERILEVEVEEGQRQNEVVERKGRKGLKTSRRLEGEESVKGEGEGVEE